MPTIKLTGLTLLAMIAFAGNSLLCRVALKETGIDAISFTTVRLVSGAIVLGLIVQLRNGRDDGDGNWLSAFALIGYAAAFSLSYRSLPAAAGALLLFGTVQATMLGYGIFTGERFSKLQTLGLCIAFAGIIGLLLPGLSAPPLWGSVLMTGAGIAWGIYSLRGKAAGDPIRITSGNFQRAALISAGFSICLLKNASFDWVGFCYACASGAVTSGIGYAIWYTVLPDLKATIASIVQLSVPVIAAAGGIIFLGEHLTLRLAFAAIAILGGIGLIITDKAHHGR